MNDGSPVTILRLLIHDDFMQRKGREEKHPPRAHGVLLMIDNHHAEPLLYVQYFKTLMPVMIADRIGE